MNLSRVYGYLPVIFIYPITKPVSSLIVYFIKEVFRAFAPSTPQKKINKVKVVKIKK